VVYVRLAAGAGDAAKEEELRRHGWAGWAGGSDRRRLSSRPGWGVRFLPGFC
jgi:hypothetical protein